ncbi:MAG: hypothetical protein HQ547_08130 [Candidatus Omnitrophica bacterium]|nr:hypothetical protein [Candidatus Omnitrophota bacterium]
MRKVRKTSKCKVEILESANEELEIRYFDDIQESSCRSWKMPMAVAKELLFWWKKLKQGKAREFPIQGKTKFCEFSMNTEKYIDIKEFDSLGLRNMTGWSLPSVVMERLIDWSRKCN